MRAFATLGLSCLSAICMAYTGGKTKQCVIKYTTDPKTGVRYHFFKHDKKGATPADNDIALVIMVYRNDKDSLILDTRKGPSRKLSDTIGVIAVQLKKTFKGCLEQGIEMMAVGDSAEFLIRADSLFAKTFHTHGLPPFVHAGTDLKFDIKLVKFQTMEQIKEEQQQQMVKKQMEITKRKAVEAQDIAKYLADNKINVQPTADSLYFLSRQEGGGRQIMEGDSVAVKYTGMLLNGKVFDATDRHGPGQETFKFVFSKTMPLIKGWILAFETMHEGDKVRILCPSSLGYGSMQASADIGPYTPLIFDIEVVKVTAGK